MKKKNTVDVDIAGDDITSIAILVGACIWTINILHSHADHS